jgi:general secretion pathway protein E
MTARVSAPRGWLELKVPQSLSWHLASPGAITAYVAKFEQDLRAMDVAAVAGDGERQADADLENLSLATISADSSPVVKLVHSTVYDALKAGASDIHLETRPAGLAVRYRLDGVLVNVANLGGVDLCEQVISRIKVMSELDIAERRVPQDGRFRLALKGRPIDFRVSVMPSVHGEDAVLRILDKKALTDELQGLRLDGLGFDATMVERLRRLSDLPYGMLLVTGPTGSGKTTTLYAAISETNTGRDKIVTIEDPVEYQLPGVLQIPVNEKKGLTFARGLRSILRHDPDKIMIGEIRDSETAQIAIQSALTGHLVFTTVHANNVFDVLGRFSHMEVDTYALVSALNGILAQRLVRIVCEQCAEPARPSLELIGQSGLAPSAVLDWTFRSGRGCAHCRGTGYKGRRAIGELLVLNDDLREAIVARAPARTLKELALAGGAKLIRTVALELVQQGATTLLEANRVTALA